MSESTGRIREQIGRIEAKVDALSDKIIEHRQAVRDSEKFQTDQREAIWVEIRTVKHDHRNEMQILYGRLDLQDRSIQEIKATQHEQSAAMGKIQAAIDGPLNSAVDFQRRISAIGLLVISVGALLWNMRDIIWQFMVFVFRLGQGPK